MRIGILGAGALGLMIAGRLAPAGHELVLFGRTGPVGETTFQLQDMSGETRAVVLPATDPTAPLDAVLVLTKSWATHDAVAGIADRFGPATVLVSLQNGLGNVEAMRDGAPHLDPARIAAGVTWQAAWRSAPDRVIHAGDGRSVIGPAFGGDIAVFEPIANALRDAGLAVETTGDVDTIVWFKLAVIAAVGGMTALTGLPNGALLVSPDLTEATVNVANEVARVARGYGVDIGDMRQAIIDSATVTAANRSSLLVSLETGQQSEIEAIHGAVVARATEKHETTPLCQLIAATIRAREASRGKDTGTSGGGKTVTEG